MPPKPLKIALVADAHIGSALAEKPPARFPERARALLRYVVAQTNSELKPDFVVQLGGVIEPSDDAEEDEDNLSTACDILRDVQVPVYHAVGVPEQAVLTAQQVCSALKLSKPYYSFSLAGFRAVVLFPERRGEEWLIGDAQMKWLSEELRSEEKHFLVFSYIPLIDFEVDEEIAVEDAGESPSLPQAELSNRAEVRNLLAQSSKVRAVFSACWHRNTLTELGGIHYVSLQSLVQSVSGARPSETYALAKIFDDDANVEIFGMDPAEFRF